ncbi:MAG: vitamin K epoxide reductase family protein [bacterium]
MSKVQRPMPNVETAVLPSGLSDIETRKTLDLGRSTLDSRFYAAVAIISLAGLADAMYLAVQHITGESVRCTLSGCSEVLSSPYASVRGIPLALLGAAAYFTVFSLATLAAFAYAYAGKLLVIVVGLMFLTTLWLLYLQAFVIKHFCQFCLISAAVTTTLLALLVVISRRASAHVN